MKKILLIIVLGNFLLFPITILAGTYLMEDGTEVIFKGLVPCGKFQAGEGESPQVTMSCQFCHIFVLFKNIIDFLLSVIVPPLAILMVVIGGFTYMFAGGNPKLIIQAKSILQSTGIALLIIYGAWAIVNTFLWMIGVNDWTGLTEGWFIIDCPIVP